jgi:hypothetical protein
MEFSWFHSFIDHHPTWQQRFRSSKPWNHSIAIRVKDSAVTGPATDDTSTLELVVLRIHFNGYGKVSRLAVVVY